MAAGPQPGSEARYAPPGASDAPVFATLPLDGFDPRALLTGPAASAVGAHFERPDREQTLVGVGVAARLPVPHGAGPAALRSAAAELLAPANEDGVLRPRLLGGFAFDPSPRPGGPWDGFDAGWLVLPRILFVRDGDTSGAVLAPGVAPDEAEALVEASSRGEPLTEEGEHAPHGPLRVLWDLNRPAWLAAVTDIAAEIRDGAYEKAVLASTLELEAEEAIDPGRALAHLRADYPHCYLFSFHRGGAVFFGATPELLVSLRGGEVGVLGLAGSARRGRTEEEDEAIAQEQLLRNAKNRIEHEIVVRALRDGLGDLVEDLHAPNQPGLLRLRNIQHLATEVTARAHPGVDVLRLVERLHPTPAVCGWPTAEARRVIEAHEHFERGWYASPVGWLDAHGDGEFAVALRSALVRGRRAWLFAGNGITGDSDPSAELAEVELKFRPLTSALGGGEM